MAAKELRGVIEQPRRGGGQLYAAVRDGGRRRRAEPPLTYLDTESGRWMTFVDARGSERWIVAAPAGGKVIATRLRHLLDSLR